MSHFVAQFARCDVRLLAARRNSPLLHARAMALYDASVNRIRDLAGELEDIRRTEPHAAFPLTQPETAFDGYGVYHWVMLLDPALRAAYVQKLDLDARYLEPDERRDMLELRSLSRDAYFEAFCKSLPPYGQEHLLGALRADGRLEFSTRCPW
ncbi:hypothetical protein M885DRAFT_545867 [Pelagophyceae sp. CCMP2097]|nr:hypothetical protein M885DRAFT_545867 [Pelagophyceae sp. CCMP2097]